MLSIIINILLLIVIFDFILVLFIKKNFIFRQTVIVLGIEFVFFIGGIMLDYFFHPKEFVYIKFGLLGTIFLFFPVLFISLLITFLANSISYYIKGKLGNQGK